MLGRECVCVLVRNAPESLVPSVHLPPLPLSFLFSFLPPLSSPLSIFLPLNSLSALSSVSSPLILFFPSLSSPVGRVLVDAATYSSLSRKGRKNLSLIETALTLKGRSIPLRDFSSRFLAFVLFYPLTL